MKGTYHGWVLGYQTANLTLAVPTVFNSTPNTASGFAYCRGGIWMSGGAPAFDAAGNMYVMTGNGAFDGYEWFDDAADRFWRQLLEVEHAEPGFSVLDYFTPMNQSTLDTNDSDVGASGTSVLIPMERVAVEYYFWWGGSKAGGLIYVIDRANWFGDGGNTTRARTSTCTRSGRRIRVRTRFRRRRSGITRCTISA